MAVDYAENRGADLDCPDRELQQSAQSKSAPLAFSWRMARRQCMGISSDDVTEANYSQLFRNYILWGVDHLLETFMLVDGVLTAQQCERTLHLLSYALKIDEAWPAACRLLFTASPTFEREGRWGDWLLCLEQGMVQSQQLGDHLSEAELCLRLGVAHRSMAQFADAQRYFLQGADHYGALRDRRNQARALNHLAWLAYLEGQTQSAGQWVADALNRLAEDDIERASSYSTLGSLALGQRAWEEAADYYRQALHLSQAHQDRYRLVWAWNDLAVALYEQKQYGEAITGYEQALALGEGIHSSVQRAVIQMNLGNVHLSTHEPTKALDYYCQAQPVFQQAYDYRHWAMVCTNQGMAFRALGQWDLAEQALLASLEHWAKNGNLAYWVDTMGELGQTYLEMGKPGEAATSLCRALEKASGIENATARNYYTQLLTTHLQSVLAL